MTQCELMILTAAVVTVALSLLAFEMSVAPVTWFMGG